MTLEVPCLVPSVEDLCPRRAQDACHGGRQAGQVPDYLSFSRLALFIKQLLVHSVFSTCAIGTLGLTCSVCTDEETQAESSGDLR